MMGVKVLVLTLEEAEAKALYLDLNHVKSQVSEGMGGFEELEPETARLHLLLENGGYGY